MKILFLKFPLSPSPRRKMALLFPFCSWWNWVLGRSSNWPKIPVSVTNTRYYWVGQNILWVFLSVKYYGKTQTNFLAKPELSEGLAWWLSGKESAGDMGSVGLGRIPGEGNDNLLKYSCREIPQTEEPGRLQAMVSPKSLTWLSN